jgi:hypothetical protein
MTPLEVCLLIHDVCTMAMLATLAMTGRYVIRDYKALEAKYEALKNK